MSQTAMAAVIVVVSLGAWVSVVVHDDPAAALGH